MRIIRRVSDPPALFLALGATAAAYLLRLPLLDVVAVPIAVLAVGALATLVIRAEAPYVPEPVAPLEPPRPIPARALLSRMELTVAELVSQNLTNREIGDRLFKGESTIDTHVDHIRNKLAFKHKSQIAVWWIQTGAEGQNSPPKSPPG